jgi:hypothetical protein
MSRIIDAGGVLLLSPIAAALGGPLVELYALLWRVGVVEVRQSERRRRDMQETLRAIRPIYPDPSANKRDGVVHWMARPRTEPVYHRAAG